MKRLIDTHPRVTAWLMFFGGLAVLLAIDHALRIRDGVVQSGGIPEVVYYGVPVILGLLATGCLWRAVRKNQKMAWGILEATGHLVVGFMLYAIALLYYVTGTGIDSL